jgi:hypothetical protein
MQIRSSIAAKTIVVLGMALVGTGCATSFSGSAHVENARAGCEAKCTGQGLELVGMVYMGEYSDACVCAVPGQHTSRSTQHILAGGAAAATTGSVGVVMAQRNRSNNSVRYQ